MQKLLVVLGQTATGKSALAVSLARRFGGEVISADSRQVYEGLAIGTGAIAQAEQRGVPHHLLGVANPRSEFSVADFKHLAEIAASDILRREKLPIVVGGTGFYIQTVVDNIVPPEVPPDAALRARLGEKSAPELLEELRRLDPDRAETIEPENGRRLVRAIEIATHLGSVPRRQEPNPKYEVLEIGLALPERELRARIEQRVRERLERGWVDEVHALLERGVPLARLRELGLGYRVLAEALADQKHSNILQNVRMSALGERIAIAEWQYAKRQARWFKRDQRIRWFHSSEETKITELVSEFLKR